MGWFSKNKISPSNKSSRDESDWQEHTSHPDLTCRTNPSQLAIVAPMEDRLAIIAATLGSLNRRLTELIPEAEALHAKAPNPGTDPDVFKAFESALDINCISDDLVTVEKFEDLGQLVKGIQNSLEKQEFDWTETFAGLLMLGTQEVLSSLTTVQLALNEPSRNVWGFTSEVFDEQMNGVFDEVHDNQSMHPIDRISATLNMVETNLMGILWMAEAIFAQKLKIEFHIHQQS